MSNIDKIDNLVSNKIIDIRGRNVILDSDVASLYGVETKRVNEAVNRNLEKFPQGYIMQLTDLEWNLLKSQFATSIKGGKTKLPIAFTERGLYMLATILKSPQATETTIAIIDTFAKVRELNQAIMSIQNIPSKPSEQKSLMEKAGHLMADLVFANNNELQLKESETTLEIGFPFIKFKQLVKKSK